MSDHAALFWRSLPRRAAPHAERADPAPSEFDLFLTSIISRLKRPFSGALKRAQSVAARVEAEQPDMDRLKDSELRPAADRLRQELLKQGFTDELSARCFALIRTAAERTTGMRHFPAQLIGGHIMLQGKLAEMGTGEGKTLTATLPAATVALAGIPVHVVTVNDYLAKRDAENMAPLYNSLGLTVGVTEPGQSPGERRAAYAADICYCTNKDLGFDYLKDTLTLNSVRGRGRLLLEKLLHRGERLDQLLLRGLYFAIVDETDSVLVDEARTPLIIAGSEGTETELELYRAALEMTRNLVEKEDFELDLTERTATLTEQGKEHLRSNAESLPAAWRSARGREELAVQGLSALHLFELDKHYLVRDGKVQIIDEYTGRVMPDRSWERGLQQLIEVKEGVEVTSQRTTLARITYQRLFSRYLRLSGMTGTALEVASELEAVCGLQTEKVPPNRPVQRINMGARLYRTRELKWQAVAETIRQHQQIGRPVLVGTRSVAASEELGLHLDQLGIEHVILNARQDSAEAEIVMEAGRTGKVTVATNMAGRGTDIHLGQEVIGKGGLHVILTEYHESKRIDRQLYGRCGRQGDPGSFEAIVSLDDDIFLQHAAKNTSIFASRYQEQQGPLPSWTARYLRSIAQQSAESINSHLRQATLSQDKKMDMALGFTGKLE